MGGLTDYPPHMRSIGAILSDKARRHGDRTYFYHDGSACTYAQLDERANRLAAGLFALGVTKGILVCSILNSSPDYLALWFGLSKAGAVEVPINTAYKGYLLEYILSFTEAETLILEEEFLDRIADIEDKLPHLKRLIVRGAGGDSANPTRFEAIPFERLSAAGDRPPDVRMDFSDLCAIVFTSGTTGPSKGAMIPVNFNYRFATRHAEIMRYGEEDVLYNFLPFFHVAGKFQALAALLVGGKMVLQEKFSVSRFWEEVRRYGVTGFLSVGGILHMLNSQPLHPDDGDNPLRKIYAVPIPKEFRADFERRFGVTMQEAYGATEDGLVLSTSWDEEFPAGSCGRPCDLYEVDIVDENDIPCPPGVSGEIVVRSREPYAMMTGYFKMPEATLSAFRNLWFHTGDRSVKDEKGWFFFLDRMKDAIRRRGENISSYEVERVINGHPKVAESAVIPVPSELGEDEVKAVVILKEGESLDPAELVSFCEKRMARFAVPRYVEFISELPRTPTQKVEKYKLRNAGVTASTWDSEKPGTSSGDRREHRQSQATKGGAGER